MTVGTELKKARENAGLSPEQISERTKIQLYKIDALENNNFELLPQGIYLDGIVRAYANEVAVDPERMVERVRLERGKLPGDWDIPFAGPIELHPASGPRDIHVIDIPGDPLDSFATESGSAVRSARHAPAAPIAPIAPKAADVRLAPNVPLAHNAPDSSHLPHVPARPARGHALLTLLVLGVLASAGWGAYVHEWTPTTTADSSASAPQPASPSDMAANDTPTSDAPAFARDTQPSDAQMRLSELSTPDAASSSAPRSRPLDPPTRAAEPAQPTSVGTSGSIQDVSGSWKLATHVESSSYSSYAGLQLGYEMQLEQNGDRVTGVGRKITENGSGIGARAQTPVTVSGTIAGDRLTLNFVERGTRRPTQGKFVLLVDEVGALRGRFSSDAAQSSGRVEAYRVSTQ